MGLLRDGRERPVGIFFSRSLLNLSQLRLETDRTRAPVVGFGDSAKAFADGKVCHV